MSEAKKPVVGRVLVKAARLSFSQNLFKPGTFQGDGDGDDESAARFKSNFLLGKTPDARASTHKADYRHAGMVDVEAMSVLRRAKYDVIAAKIGEDKAQALLSKIKPDKYAVRDGDLETWEGYDGSFYISAASDTPPRVIGRDKRVITAESGIVYAGCIVNAMVTMWYQPAGTRVAKGGKKIMVPHGVWARLNAVQFVKDGDPFGAPPPDMDEFDDLSGEGGETDFDADGDDSPL